jgi:hypothetical protein
MIGAVLLLAACAGQDTAAPCEYRLNVFDMPNTQVGLVVPVDLELTVKSGSCQVPTNANVTWIISNTNIVEFVSQTNTTAQVRAKKAGSAFITAFLTLTPEARDSITFTVLAPVDQ